jgi:hypothetical protein
MFITTVSPDAGSVQVKDPSSSNMFYCNVAKNNHRLYTILACNKWDVLFISDSPWFKIGSDRKSADSPEFNVFGTTNNSVYQLFQSRGPRDQCFVSIYVKRSFLTEHSVKPRLDLINHEAIMIIEIDHCLYTLVYNRPAYSNLSLIPKRIREIEFPLDFPSIIIGDFNLHSALWDERQTGRDPGAGVLTDWADDANYTFLNEPDKPTFARHIQVPMPHVQLAVFDLFLINSDCFPDLVSDWEVNYH